MKTFSDQDYQLDAKYADHEGPPAAPDCRGRTAGGLGGAAPASLDLYGQSRTYTVFDFGLPLLHMYSSTLGLIAMCH